MISSVVANRLARCTRVHDLLGIHARERAEQVALQVRDTTLSYKALHTRVERLAGQLLVSGLKPGERIALLAKNDPAFCELMMAASRIRIVLVPINVRLAVPEVEFIVRDADVRMLFVGSEFQATAALVGASCSCVRSIVKISDDGSYDGWLPADTPVGPTEVAFDNDILFQMYTSGTTGQPKGALISQKNVLTVMRNGCARLGPFDEKSISLVCMPLFHIAGSSWLFFGLAVGCRSLLVVNIDPGAILDTFEQHRVSCTLLVPSVIHMIVTAAEAQHRTVPSLQTLAFGASPMPTELLRRAQRVFPGTDFLHVYGMTETTGMFTSLPPDELKGGRRLESCGLVFDDAAVRIVDPQGDEVSVGVVGEIICKTPQLMAGYWNRPQATVDAIQDDWFHTGDAGSVDSGGFLYIRDRIKDLVISGGENVYPAEVEGALLAHHAVAEVAVIGIPDATWGEAVLAAVVPSTAAHIDEDELKAFARERLAGFKVPKRIERVDSLPRNAAGKVTKDVLRSRFTPQG